jgi:PAS domain S-box-containing protein
MARTTMSEHERRVARLRELDALFESAFEHTAIGMAVVSSDGRPLEVNAALAGMLGYSREELLQKRGLQAEVRRRRP